MTGPRVIYWFRTDLRLHDSPALTAALDLKPDVLWPIWTWDPKYVYRQRAGPNRWKFLLDCQNDLSASLTKLNPKSRLFVLREGPQTLLPKLFKAWKPTHLVFERDYDGYAKERDDTIMALAKEAGVEVITRGGRTLWDSDEIVKHHGGKPPMTLHALQDAASKIGPVPRPLPAPGEKKGKGSFPGPGELNLPFEQDPPKKNKDFNAQWRKGSDTEYTGGLSGPNNDFGVPTMSECGFAPNAATTPHKGGETEGLRRLHEAIAEQDGDYLATFRKPQTSPAAFDPPATTVLSPFNHFGALSPRMVYWAGADAVEAYKKKHKGGGNASTPPESMTGQMMFRDMYFAAMAGNRKTFGQTVGNKHVRFIPWHLPSRVDKETGIITGEYDVDNPEAEKWFQRWRVGQTGFPWIDALMRQLAQEGWIHHLGRHSVACFLTRGGAYVDWERGAQVFAEFLIDHETSCNAGNWQWLSCTAFFSQYYRMYSPVSFGKKWDHGGSFVRRYVPELAGMDAKYIYEPWKCPLPDQKKAGVRVTGDGMGGGVENGDKGVKTYPKPMFDFDERRKICLASMKQAYAVGLHGDDPRVMSGEWKKLFEEHKGDGETDMQGDLGLESDHGEHADNAGGDGESAVKPKTTGKGKGGNIKADGKRKQGTLDGHVDKKQKQKAKA